MSGPTDDPNVDPNGGGPGPGPATPGDLPPPTHAGQTHSRPVPGGGSLEYTSVPAGLSQPGVFVWGTPVHIPPPSTATTPEERATARTTLTAEQQAALARQNDATAETARHNKVMEGHNADILAATTARDDADRALKKAMADQADAIARGAQDEIKRNHLAIEAASDKKEAADEAIRKAELGLKAETEYAASRRADAATALAEKQYQDKLATEPGNYYNYVTRMFGGTAQMAPGAGPAQAADPNSPQALAAAGKEPIGRQNVGDWRNYSLAKLETFPDEYLLAAAKAGLPLASFRNEFLLGRPALMAHLDPSRISGTGDWAGKGTGFSQDVIDKWGKGAPTPPAATDTAAGAGSGINRITPDSPSWAASAADRAALTTASTSPAGPAPATSAPVGAAPAAAGPTVADAIAAANAIVAQQRAGVGPAPAAPVTVPGAPVWQPEPTAVQV